MTSLSGHVIVIWSMKRAKKVLVAALILTFLLGPLAWKEGKAAAQAPARKTTIVVKYTEYEWWLIQWVDNQILCRILADHSGLPTGDEVLKSCGTDLFTQWQSTPPCAAAEGGADEATRCDGLYLFLVSSQPKQREVLVNLPVPVVWVTLEGCNPSPPENRCETLPTLVLTGVEPLPNERITAIHGTLEGNPFNCDGDVCKLPLRITPLQGVQVEFWADSSFGDSSEHFTAQVRVIDTGVSAVPGSTGYYVDVFSTQWQGAQLASCARTWGAFPPVGGPPEWLSTPDQPELLASGAPYYYLAGRLISQGLVDVSACSSGGLLPNGYADACGLEKARSMVDTWQNKFDTRIIEVAKDTSIPAVLLKNLFAQESQFWPGVFRVSYEYGLGQLTDKGMDAVLLWNSDFFDQFCPLVLTNDGCSRGYLHLQAGDQAILRGALALGARSDCSNCPTGIDLKNVDYSVGLFANMIKANCDQVGELVTTATGHIPGEVSTYEDLWRLTVANYHAGPGCVSYAIHSAWQGSGVLTWDLVAERFTEPCRGVIPYVEKITR